MYRPIIIATIIVLIFLSNSFAGFGSYNSPYRSDTVVAPIIIKEKGLYNMVVSIQFLNEPYDQKKYKTDEYESFIKRLSVEWSGVALHEILKVPEQNVSDLAELKKNIETEIAKLADQLKTKYKIEKNVEVVFSLSNFFVLEPREK